MLYRFIYEKIKRIEIMTQLEENKDVYEDPKQVSVVLNKNFQKVYTIESYFKKTQVQKKNKAVGKHVK